MSGVQLDGGNRIVGTEFIKVWNTGTSNLATENYVLEQVALGSGGTSTTDLSGYYNLTQTNTLLDAKYNITAVMMKPLNFLMFDYRHWHKNLFHCYQQSSE